MRPLVLGSALFASAIVAVNLAPSAGRAAPTGPLHEGCWIVIDPDDDPTFDNAQEVLCVDASGRAAIRESSYYGEGVKGCNVVTIRAQDGKFVVDVDYKRCTNDAPSHTLTCDKAAASGAFPCMQLMAAESGAGLPVKLAPLPAGQ